MIEEIRKKIEAGLYEYSEHALDQTIIRRISEEEVREAFENAKIIEDYPHDKYGPSCLVFGKTRAGRAVHIQSSYPSRHFIKIITLYEPDADSWLNFEIRR